jgi:tRNA (mo5U34)-methyltransferase
MPEPWTPERVREAIAGFPLWYHVLELAGVETPGVYDMRPFVPQFGIPSDLRGWRVLDVGASSGFFSFLCEARGAAEVVAADLPSWADHDYSRWYRDSKLAAADPGALQQIDWQQVHGPFALARGILGSRVGRVLSTVYDLPRKVEGKFDLVLFSHVIAHVRDPVLALEAIRDVLAPDGVAVIAASVLMSPRSIPEARFMGDVEGICWWVPSPEGLEAWCRMAGFSRVAPLGHFQLETLRGPKSVAQILVVHARVT